MEDSKIITSDEDLGVEETMEPVAQESGRKIFGKDMQEWRERVAKTSQEVKDNLKEGLGKLKEKEFSEIVKDVKDYIAEHPGQFLAGTFLFGYFLGRIRKKV